MALDPAIISALYQALLGRDADDDGLGFWTTADAPEEVIAGLSRSPEGKARLRQLAAAVASQPEGAQGLARLRTGGGRAACGDVPSARIAAEVLPSLPVAEVAAGLPAPRIAVAGPYAPQLAGELARRGAGEAAAVDPLSGAEAADVLVLTDPAAAAVLAWGAPHVLEQTTRRVVCPAMLDFGAAAWLAREALSERCSLLHGLGFAEVRVMLFRRHGGVTDVLQISHGLPEAEHPLTLRDHLPDPISRPPSAWCFADRVPTHDRL